jgi:dynein heavy chain
MKNLLTKISNQIIKRCRAKINKDDMLDGDVDKCINDLNESIECCNKWQEICQGAQETIKMKSTRNEWTLDKDKTIFAEIEAFIQRCKDIKEICEAQLQFARKSPTITMPHFGGTKGPEITDNLMELETIF